MFSFHDLASNEGAMANNIWGSYPPRTSSEQLEYLAKTVKDWTIFNGLTVRPNPSFVNDETNPNHVLATNAPVTLYPSPFPRKCFEQAQRLQALYNELYAAIASDEAWLGQIMQEYVSLPISLRSQAPATVTDPANTLQTG